MDQRELSVGASEVALPMPTGNELVCSLHAMGSIFLLQRWLDGVAAVILHAHWCYTMHRSIRE